MLLKENKFYCFYWNLFSYEKILVTYRGSYKSKYYNFSLLSQPQDEDLFFQLQILNKYI